MPSLYGAQHAARQWIAGQIFRFRRRPDDPERIAEAIANPRAVLLVIAGMLGDTVMSTPVIAAARSIWPSTKLTLLGQRHNIALLEGCPELDDHIETPYLPFSIRHRRELRRVQQQVTDGGFDVAMLILGDQFALMAAEAAVPVRVGVSGHALGPCLTHEYAGTPRSWGPNERLNALRALGFQVPTATPRLMPSAESVMAAAESLSRRGLRSAEQYAVIHPFSNARARWWPIGYVQDLAVALQRAHGLRPVLLGGPEARDAVAASGVRDHVIDATCPTIRELVGVIQGAALVVSTDSGPFHIAGALGRPVVGLFKERYPDHAGRYPNARALFGHNSICMRECEYNRCATTPCRQMSALAVSEVLAAAREALMPPRVGAAR